MGTLRNWLKDLATFSLDYPKIWIGLKAVVTVVPAILVAFVAVGWFSKPPPSQDFLRSLLDAHYWLAVLLIALPISLPHLFSVIDCIAVESKKKDDALSILQSALLNGLNQLVGQKMRRFSDYYRRMKDGEQKGIVFEEITKPELQFEAILVTLHSVLHETYPTERFEIVLVRIENKLPVKFVARYPSNLQLEESLLNAHAKRTFFHHCADLKDSKYLSDIADYLKNTKPDKRFYHPIGPEDEDRGSIICCPLFCDTTGQVEFILSIKADNAKVIGKKFKQRYEASINTIKTRILLEHNLWLIKQRTA